MIVRMLPREVCCGVKFVKLQEWPTLRFCTKWSTVTGWRVPRIVLLLFMTSCSSAGTRYSASFKEATFCKSNDIYSPRNFSMLRNLTGCNETSYFWDPAVEVGRLFHDVGLGVQGRLRLLTCASAPRHHFVSFLAYCIAVSTLLYQSYVHTVTSVS